MSKYDFNIDVINPNTAHGKVLMRISPGSEVLECGCAMGYMTRYMHEELGCEVDVVEKDSYALHAAMEYARRGLRCDLNSSGWHEFYKERLYDFILFADVLEHLTNSEYTLNLAKDLLKQDGRIIVSIPNICHNDIILKMLNDRFTYTRYGLLDDTHVHFWGLHDFHEFAGSVGLDIVDTDRVIVPTGFTEQRPDVSKAPQMLRNLLNQRENGTVFQWVFVLAKKKRAD